MKLRDRGSGCYCGENVTDVFFDLDDGTPAIYYYGDPWDAGAVKTRSLRDSPTLCARACEEAAEMLENASEGHRLFLREYWRGRGRWVGDCLAPLRGPLNWDKEFWKARSSTDSVIAVLRKAAEHYRKEAEETK